MISHKLLDQRLKVPVAGAFSGREPTIALSPRCSQAENEQLKLTVNKLQMNLEHVLTDANWAASNSPRPAHAGAFMTPDSHSAAARGRHPRRPYQTAWTPAPRARSHSPATTTRHTLSAAAGDPVEAPSGPQILNFCTQCGHRLHPGTSLCTLCNTMHLFPNSTPHG